MLFHLKFVLIILSQYTASLKKDTNVNIPPLMFSIEFALLSLVLNISSNCPADPQVTTCLHAAYACLGPFTRCGASHPTHSQLHDGFHSDIIFGLIMPYPSHPASSPCLPQGFLQLNGTRICRPYIDIEEQRLEWGEMQVNRGSK